MTEKKSSKTRLDENMNIFDDMVEGWSEQTQRWGEEAQRVGEHGLKEVQHWIGESWRLATAQMEAQIAFGKGLQAASRKLFDSSYFAGAKD